MAGVLGALALWTEPGAFLLRAIPHTPSRWQCHILPKGRGLCGVGIWSSGVRASREGSELLPREPSAPKRR